MIKRIFNYFSMPRRLAMLNTVFIAIILGLNSYFPAFCVPTNWTIIVLIICFTNTITFPFFEKKSVAPFLSFINGVSFFVFLYCIIFLEYMNYVGIVLLLTGIGIIFLIPHFFVIQILYKNLIKPAIKSSRYYFLGAIIICSLIVVFIGRNYQKAMVAIDKFEKSNFETLEKNFMTEKILGMHFIYHTRYCEFDGWRPPKHEPILVIGMWLNKRKDPLKVDLKKRLELYKKFFPANQYKFDCSCCYQYRLDYHNSPFWTN